MVLRVGVTGGIGSGKSTVCQLFRDLDVPVIDADEIAREVVAPGKPALAEISRTFGTWVLQPDGTLDRVRLREHVFSDNDARHRLEAMLHPAIRTAIESQVEGLADPYCIIAIPLLVEKEWGSFVDRVLVVDAPIELQIERTQARDGLARAQVEKIMQAQATREERLARADDVICNDGDLNALRETVTILHQRYLRLAGQ